jgi:hypothetical protein
MWHAWLYSCTLFWHTATLTSIILKGAPVAGDNISEALGADKVYRKMIITRIRAKDVRRWSSVPQSLHFIDIAHERGLASELWFYADRHWSG